MDIEVEARKFCSYILITTPQTDRVGPVIRSAPSQCLQPCQNLIGPHWSPCSCFVFPGTHRNPRVYFPHLLQPYVQTSILGDIVAFLAIICLRRRCMDPNSCQYQARLLLPHPCCQGHCLWSRTSFVPVRMCGTWVWCWVPAWREDDARESDFDR